KVAEDNASGAALAIGTVAAYTHEDIQSSFRLLLRDCQLFERLPDVYHLAHTDSHQRAHSLEALFEAVHARFGPPVTLPECLMFLPERLMLFPERFMRGFSRSLMGLQGGPELRLR